MRWGEGVDLNNGRAEHRETFWDVSQCMERVVVEFYSHKLSVSRVIVRSGHRVCL